MKFGGFHLRHPVEELLELRRHFQTNGLTGQVQVDIHPDIFEGRCKSKESQRSVIHARLGALETKHA